MKTDKDSKQGLKIKDFISISTQLAFNACQILRQASQNKSLKTYSKSANDPVTQADFHIQTMIVNGLRKFFPKLLVIGQEQVDYKGKIAIDYEKLNYDCLPPETNFANLQIPYDQICVWIDPIDCTYGFIDGNLQEVTTLIGMSRKNQAYIGIIGVPFQKLQLTRKFLPSVNIGVVQTKQAFVCDHHKNWTPLMIKPIHNTPLITTSEGRVDHLFVQIVEHLKGNGKYSGGAGRKCMMVVNGETDLMAYIAGYTAKWDTCAGQAIVRAMGGYFLTKRKTQEVYDPKAADYTNYHGQICTMNKQLMDKVYEYLEKINPTLDWSNYKVNYVKQHKPKNQEKQEKPKQTLNMGHFMSIAGQLASQACQIINQAHMKMDMKYYKSMSSPTTQADYHIQAMIIKGFRKFFPKLKVIGQEQNKFKGEINVSYESFKMDFYPIQAKFDNLQVPYDEICAWIDPIDATYALIDGRMDYVTTLIGLARNKSAYAGVIGLPFQKISQIPYYQPQIYIGVTETKQAFVWQNDSQWKPLKKSPLNKNLVIASSGRRMTTELSGLLKHIQGKFKISGGSGKKAMMVAKGQADVLLYRQNHTCMWDSCAGDAIIQAMGGHYVTYQNEPLVYDSESDEFQNQKGQICTLHKQVLDKVLEYMKNNK